MNCKSRSLARATNAASAIAFSMLFMCRVPCISQCALPGQTGKSAFDAVSIKALATLSPIREPLLHIDPERLSASNLTLRWLIREAYGIRADQVEGGPKWLDEDQFSVQATTAFPANRAQMLEMLRHSIEHRFHLVCSFKSASKPLFALVVAPGGTKLKSLTTDGTRSLPPGGEMSFDDIGELVIFLNNLSGIGVLAHPVVDETGLSGKYNIHFRIGAGSAASGQVEISHDNMQVATSLERELGLQLVKRTIPDLTMFIVTANHPSGN